MNRYALTALIILGGVVMGCTTSAQRRFAEYEPAAQTCITALEKMKSFSQSDVGQSNWNAALADVNTAVAKLKEQFSDEAALPSYAAIVEAARLYGGARSVAQQASATPDEHNGDTEGSAYIRDAERDNALPLGAFKTAQASAALKSEK